MSKKRDLSYESTDNKKYVELSNNSSSPFYKRSYAYIFIYSAIYAIYKKLLPIKLKKKASNIPLEAFEKIDKHWILKAMLVSEKNNYDILYDEIGLFDLMERYANAGLKKIYKEIAETPGDFDKKILKELKSNNGS